ncbi:MAG: RNA polymerase sigma factor [Acidobacteria bacterium]|nr:RNA polymerase sigma factor [Acidobacteriota bacterium]
MQEDEIRAVFTDFYESWYSSLVRYVAHSIGSVELAKDLVQDSFYALCVELRQGKQIDNPKGWTFRVLRRQISKQIASSRYSGVRFESVDSHPDWSRDDFVHEGLRVEPQQGRDTLSEMTAHLSAREHEVLLLRLEGFKYKEIATQLGIGSETVKTLLARAMEKMQARFGGGRPSLRVNHVEDNA